MTELSRWSMVSLCPLPGFVKDTLRSAFELTEVQAPTPETLAECALGHDVLLTSVTAPLRAGYVDALPTSIRAVASYSVGLDHLDVPRLRDRGIALFNTPDVLTESVADVALLHVLATLRRATESIELIRSRQWAGWTPLQLNGHEASGKQLGIFGMGRIGRAIARRARAFGMVVHYCNRRRLPAAEEEEAKFHADAGHFLSSIDVLILAAPSSDSTRHFINSARIACLRPGSIIVNIARGDLVDDEALVAALKSGHVSAAGLDVFNGEPAIDPRYFELDNVFMTPHIGSSTVEARRRMAEILVSGIEQWRRGQNPRNRVA
jgi:lactate dehydrogenase-like 2-hydroxyacid dehydrogenase